jgi:predicted ATP-dependent serine protease
MELKIKKHKIKNTVDVVAIDFVQNIMAKGDDIYNQMREVAIKLQKIAKKHNICMLGLSQISEGKDKGSISLRGAQELASSADIVLWIDRKPDVPAFDLIIRKNRPFGVTGKIPMTFSQTWTNIKEVN